MNLSCRASDEEPGNGYNRAVATTIHTTERRPQHDGTQPPPLLLMLHGFGSNERDLFSFASYLNPTFHIVAARGILNMGFGYAWYQLYGGPGNLRPDPLTRGRAIDVLSKFVRDLPARLGTDPQRTYLLGFSQGAILSLALALQMPEHIAGIVPISGYLDPETIPAIEPDRLSHLRALMIHGLHDELIPIEAARQSRSFLEKTPIKLTYREYPVGHTIHSDALGLIREWLEKDD
jgi:phospholipase/carboxylesterase